MSFAVKTSVPTNSLIRTSFIVPSYIYKYTPWLITKLDNSSFEITFSSSSSMILLTLLSFYIICLMTPELRQLFIVLVLYITKNVGIHLPPIRFLRPTTALSADEQSDTHERLLIHPLVCCEGVVCLQAHNGIHFQHTRGIHSAMSLALFLQW